MDMVIYELLVVVEFPFNLETLPGLKIRVNRTNDIRPRVWETISQKVDITKKGSS